MAFGLKFDSWRMSAAEQRGVDAVACGRRVDLGGERRRGAGRGGRAGRGRRRSRVGRAPAATRRTRWATRRTTTAAPAPPTGASEAIMAWICSIRSKATAALISCSLRRWMASAISSSADAAAVRVGGLMLGAVALLEALEDLAALLRRGERLTARLDLGVAAGDLELGLAAVGLDALEPQLLGDESPAASSGAPARRASRAWRTRSAAAPAARQRRARGASGSPRTPRGHGPRRARAARAHARARSGTGSHPRSG